MPDDIVTQLRAPNAGVLSSDWDVMRRIMLDAADEIERLRAAGNALYAAVRNHDLAEAHLKGWEDARRG